MGNGARRLALACVCGGMSAIGGLGASEVPTGAQAHCDPNYAPTAAGYVPGDRDYDCPELHAMGLGDIPVIGNDWQRLDGYYDYNMGVWESYADGLACEWLGE